MYEKLISIAGQLNDPVEAERAITKEFHNLLEIGAIPAWKPGFNIPLDKKRILVGVAPSWNTLDRKFLVALENYLNNAKTNDVATEIFDAGECQSYSALSEYIPGIKDVYHLPVLGIWVNGSLVETANGFAARQYLGNLLGLDHDYSHKE